MRPPPGGLFLFNSKKTGSKFLNLTNSITFAFPKNRVDRCFIRGVLANPCGAREIGYEFN
jgi:hypothetical protein